MKFWEPFRFMNEEVEEKPWLSVLVNIVDLAGDQNTSKKNQASNASLRQMIVDELDLEYFKRESEMNDESPGISAQITATYKSPGSERAFTHRVSAVSKDLERVEVTSYLIDDKEISKEKYANVRDAKGIADLLIRIAGEERR